MKIVVTGASGFVGGHLVRHLANNGYQVVATTRRGGPIISGVQWQESPPLSAEADCDWLPVLKDACAVVHLAGLAHVPASKQGPAYLRELRSTNVAGTLRLFRNALECCVPSFVFMSSVAALTSRSVGRLDAQTEPKPSSPYGQSKRAAEIGLQELAAAKRTRLVILRPPVIYGPGNPANMDRLFRLVRTGLPLPFGRVKNRRSLLFVGNLCDCIARILRHAARPVSPLLISDGVDLSTPQLIEHIAKNSGRRVRFWPFPNAVFNLIARRAPDSAVAKLTGSLFLDTTPLQQTFQWTPPFTPQEGLAETLR